MVVRVDQARHHQMAAGIDHLGGGLRQVGSGADALDQVVTDEDGSTGELVALVVKGGHAVRVADQQGGHIGAFRKGSGGDR